MLEHYFCLTDDLNHEQSWVNKQLVSYIINKYIYALVNQLLNLHNLKCVWLNTWFHNCVWLNLRFNNIYSNTHNIMPKMKLK